MNATPTAAVAAPEEDPLGPLLAAATGAGGDSFDGPSEVLAGIARLETLKALMDAAAVELAGLLAVHVQSLAVGDLPADATPLMRGQARIEARTGLADEIALETGMKPYLAADLVEFAAAPTTRTARLREELSAGASSWDRVRTVFSKTKDLPEDVVGLVADAVFRPGPQGGPASEQVFRQRLGRQARKHTCPERRRRQVRRDRRCTLDTYPDGAATLALTGPVESLVGAFERIDDIARTMRRHGDPRTLAQLRFDIGAGLMTHAQPTRPGAAFGGRDGLLDEAHDLGAGAAFGVPTSQPTASATAAETRTGAPADTTAPDDATDATSAATPGATAPPTGPTTPAEAPADETDQTDSMTTAEAEAAQFAAALSEVFPGAVLPVVKVTVIVSAASLLGANDEPGFIPGHGDLDAQTVREMALAEGGTWRRLVVDPVTGYAMSTTSPSYAPPPRMARAVRDRDGTCRYPGCAHPADKSDLDHVTPAPAGPTTGENLQSLHRRHHQRKTKRLWAARILPDGTVTWRTPLGRIHTTTPFDYRTYLGDTAPGDASRAAGPGGGESDPGGTSRQGGGLRPGQGRSHTNPGGAPPAGRDGTSPPDSGGAATPGEGRRPSGLRSEGGRASDRDRDRDRGEASSGGTRRGHDHHDGAGRAGCGAAGETRTDGKAPPEDDPPPEDTGITHHAPRPGRRRTRGWDADVDPGPPPF